MADADPPDNVILDAAAKATGLLVTANLNFIRSWNWSRSTRDSRPNSHEDGAQLLCTQEAELPP